MPDATITATTSIDTSGFGAGLAILKEQYAQASTEVRQSVQRVVDAEKQATEAIAAGHTQLASVLQGAANQEREALNGLIEKQLELKTAVEAANAALGHQVSATIAAGAEMRVLEGAMPIRAAEQFLARVSGLGPIIQAAFPVFGAIALGEVLVHMGEAAYKLYERFDEVAQAEKRATEEAKAFDTELKQIKASMQQMQDQQFELLFGKTASLAEKASRATNEELQLRLRIESVLDAIAAKQKEASEAYKDAAASAPVGVESAGDVGAIERRAVALKDIETLTKELALAQDELTRKQTAASLLTTQLSLAEQQDREKQIAGIDRAAKQSESAQRTAQEAERKAVAEGLKQQEDAYGKHNQAVIRYLQEKWDAEAAYPALQQEISDKIVEIFRAQEKGIAEVARKGAEIQAKQQKEAEKRQAWLVQMALESERIADEIGAKIARDATELADLKAKQAEAEQIGGLEMQRAKVQRGAALGFDTSVAAKVAEAQALKAIDQQIADDQIAAEQQLLSRLKAQYGEDSKNYQDELLKKDKLQQQENLKIYNDQTNILRLQQQNYQTFFNTINQGFQRSFDQWLTGHKSFVAGLQQLWTQMVTNFANVLIQMGLKFVEREIFMTLVHATNVQQQVSTTAAGAIATNAITATTTQVQLQREGVQAAAATYAAVSAIPIIGPALANPAALAAYGTVVALGSLAGFETGGIIPNTGVALVHQGEAVLPAPLTQTLMNASGGGFTNNGGIHIHTSAGADGKKMGIDLMTQLRRMNVKMA